MLCTIVNLDETLNKISKFYLTGNQISIDLISGGYY